MDLFEEVAADTCLGQGRGASRLGAGDPVLGLVAQGKIRLKAATTSVLDRLPRYDIPADAAREAGLAAFAPGVAD